MNNNTTEKRGGKEIAAKVATITGMKPLRARMLTGSMRGYFGTCFKFDGTQNELRILLTQLLGFAPFFVQSNFDGTFEVNLEIAKLDGVETLKLDNGPLVVFQNL